MLEKASQKRPLVRQTSVLAIASDPVSTLRIEKPQLRRFWINGEKLVWWWAIAGLDIFAPVDQISTTFGMRW